MTTPNTPNRAALRRKYDRAVDAYARATTPEARAKAAETLRALHAELHPVIPSTED